jgi:signal transduction histidine kinase
MAHQSQRLSLPGVRRGLYRRPGREFATRMPAQADTMSAATLASPSLVSLPIPRWSLARQFLLANLIVVLVGVLITGAWLGNQIQTSVLDRTAVLTSLYVDSVVSPHLQSLSTSGELSPDDIAALDNLIANTSLGAGVVVFKVWSPDGRIVYSPDRRLMGRQFPVDPFLARSLEGDVTAEISDLEEPENEYERAGWSRLIEVYEPVRDTLSGNVIASTEFYQLPDALEADIAQAQLRAWIVVGVSGLLTYLLLAGIVKRGSDTIRSQEKRLRHQLGELQRVLNQNARLHERVRQAAGRTTALNEQALRRISADLHDGPGQTLALALLRLESLQQPCEDAACTLHNAENPDFAIVHGAVKDALAELRAISAGLRLPELAPLTLADVAERAICDHERRSGTRVDRRLGRLPEQAPLAIKIGLLRTLQEALSNATRHGGGVDLTASVWAEDGMLRLEVSDRGPGFDPTGAERKGRLGLAGMRERAELLGGTFEITSRLGKGTIVRASWPLPEHAELVT